MSMEKSQDDDAIKHTRHDKEFDKPVWEEMDDTPLIPDDETLGVDAGEDEDDIEIDVVDDTPEQDRGRRRRPDPDPVTDEELGNYSAGVQKRIKSLTRNQHDLRREKEALERERAELARVNRELLGRVRSTSEQAHGLRGKAIEQGKAAAEAALAESRRAYQKAVEDGDTEAQATATENMMAARAVRDRVAQEEQSYLQAPIQPVEEEIYSPPEGGTADQRAAQWQQENSWFGKDRGMTGYALGLHNELAESGVQVGSDEYYNQLNTKLRQTFPDKFADGPDDDELTAQDPPRRRRRGSPVAPVSSSRGPRARKVTLTETQVAIAEQLGIPLKTYAKQFADSQETE